MTVQLRLSRHFLWSGGRLRQSQRWFGCFQWFSLTPCWCIQDFCQAEVGRAQNVDSSGPKKNKYRFVCACWVACTCACIGYTCYKSLQLLAMLYCASSTAQINSEVNETLGSDCDGGSWADLRHLRSSWNQMSHGG